MKVITKQTQKKIQSALKYVRNQDRAKYVYAFVAIVIFGLITLALSKAATSSVGIEAENGVGTARTFGDDSASGGNGIRFGQPYKDLFVSTSGNNAKDGSTQANAVQTIKRAVELSNGPTRIRILAGTYIEQIVIQKNDLIIEPFGNGDVTVNGAIPEFISGVNWIYVDNGVWRHDLGRDEFAPDGNTIYTADGKQQWSYPDYFQLMGKQTVNQLPGVFVNNSWLNGGVLVATSNGQPPTAPLYIGGRTATFDIQSANNISLNSVSGSKLKIMYGNANILARSSNNITVDGVDITGGGAGIGAFDTSNVTIKNSTIHGGFERTWDGSDVKERAGSKTMENQAIIVRATSKDISNIVIDNNHTYGYWAGIHFPTLFARSTDTRYYNSNSVISNNLVHDHAGPGIEPEAPFKNLIVRGNTVYDSFEPFSPTPASVGPTYVYENLFIANRPGINGNGVLVWSPSYSIKMQNDSVDLPGNIHFYYNTLYFAGNSGNLRKTVQSTAGLLTKDATFTNNIFYSYEGGIVRGTGRVEDGSDWDGNVFYSQVLANDNYFAWNSLYDPADTSHRYQSLGQIVSGGAMPSQWVGNVEGNPSFNCVLVTNRDCFKASASITKPSSMQMVPGSYPESGRLNSRTRIGAFE